MIQTCSYSKDFRFKSGLVADVGFDVAVVEKCIIIGGGCSGDKAAAEKCTSAFTRLIIGH